MKPLLRRVLRKPAVLEATGYRATQLDLLVSQGRFPKPIKLSAGGRATGWFEDEIIQFQQERLAERDHEIKRK